MSMCFMYPYSYPLQDEIVWEKEHGIEIIEKKAYILAQIIIN